MSFLISPSIAQTVFKDDEKWSFLISLFHFSFSRHPCNLYVFTERSGTVIYLLQMISSLGKGLYVCVLIGKISKQRKGPKCNSLSLVGHENVAQSVNDI